MAEWLEEVERLSLLQYCCNRCMYYWDGNDGICPICGNECTHELKYEEETNGVSDL